jgi:septum formation topological specificity factor MinE
MAEQMKRGKAAARNRARRLKIVVAKSRLALKAKGK